MHASNQTSKCLSYSNASILVTVFRTEFTIPQKIERKRNEGRLAIAAWIVVASPSSLTTEYRR